MYLVDGDAYDIDKINNAIGESAKKETEKIDSESFIFSSKWYFIFEYTRLVIETEQNDEASAFEIYRGVEIS
jgi:hypothetical protein